MPNRASSRSGTGRRLPRGNTAEGQNALLSRTTGGFNTANGFLSLRSDTTGSFNTAIGAGTLLANTGDSNTASGAGALLSNITGTDNTADGAFALFFNTATGNTAIGSKALLNNTTGGTLGNIQGLDFKPNVAVGWQALESNTVAGANTAVGYQALHSFTAGPVSFEHLGLCTAVGFQALANTIHGFGNSAFGYHALFSNTDGAANVAIGPFALSANTTGDSNVAVGDNALVLNTTGEANIAIGFAVLENNDTGIHNTAVGLNALDANISGSSNTALGEFAGGGVTTADNVICIGANVFGADVSDSCYIGNIFGQTSVNGVQVLINSDKKLGTVTSSKRFKEEIKPMNNTSESLFALKPVTFRYKKDIDPAGTSQFGLVAEDVENVNPDLVVHDKEGKPYSVRYDQINAMLLNEFLKEHKKVEEQQTTIADLKSTASKQDATIAQQQKDFHAAIARQENEIRELTASLKEQAAQIQKVSAQIEMSKAPPKLVLNNP